MDGVIVDSESLYRKMNTEFIRSRGGDAGRMDYDRYIGIHAWDMWADLKKLFGLDEPVDELVDMEKRAKFDLLRTEPLLPVAGAEKLIAELRGAGMALAVASSSLRPNVELVLDRLGLRSSFGHVVAGNDVENGKPAPDIFLKAAELAGAAPGACAVIEDSGNGVLGAKRAGMLAIGLVSEDSGDQDLSCADHVVYRLSDIRMAMFRS